MRGANSNRCEGQSESRRRPGKDGNDGLWRPGPIEGTRELVIQRTPYIAAYRIERETVAILRVLHGAQEWADEMESKREM